MPQSSAALPTACSGKPRLNAPCCHEVDKEQEDEGHEGLIQEADQGVEGCRAGHPDALPYAKTTGAAGGSSRRHMSTPSLHRRPLCLLPCPLAPRNACAVVFAELTPTGLQFDPRSTCGSITLGTAGPLFPPTCPAAAPLMGFPPDLCRPPSLECAACHLFMHVTPVAVTLKGNYPEGYPRRPRRALTRNGSSSSSSAPTGLIAPSTSCLSFILSANWERCRYVRRT